MDIQPATWTQVFRCFEHTPLSRDRIRLLKIQDSLLGDNPPQHPTEFQADIHVSFEEHDISECPPYIALSYTWGYATQFVDPTGVDTRDSADQPIFCQGGTLWSSPNLLDALRHLRMNQQRRKRHPNSTSAAGAWADLSGMKSELYWIDSLCINLDNLVERSAQVALVGQIYKQATLCLVWLGGKDDFAQVAMNLAAKVWHESSTEETTKSRAPGCRDELLQQKAQRLLHDVSEDVFQALAIFFSRTWFSRLWVVQEVVLPPVVWAQCGDLSIEFTRLMNLGRLLMHGTDFTTMTFDRVLKLKTLGIDLHEDEDAYFYINTPSFLAAVGDIRSELKVGKQRDFANLTQTFEKLDTSELRDCVYSILAITAEFSPKPGQSPVITPNYNLPVNRVFIEAVAAISRHKNDLSFLSLANGQRRKSIPNLPSWCPDFSCCMVRPYFPKNHGTKDQVSKLISEWKTPNQKALDIEISDNRLNVEGLLYDTVTCVPRGDHQDPSVQSIASLLDFAFGLGINLAESLDSMWTTILRIHADSMAAISPPDDETHTEESAQQVTHVQHELDFMIHETEKLRRVVQRIRQSDPRIPLSLPADSTLSWLSNTLKDLGPEKTYADLNNVRNQAADLELRLIPHRAQEAGVEGQLKDLMNFCATCAMCSQIEYDHLLHLVDMIFLPASDDPFPKSSMYSTRSCQLGVVQALVVPGDEVWLLNGFDVPVVLRPTEKGMYSFCGVTYIRGSLKAENLEMHRPASGGPIMRKITIE
ncbi:putative ankyrin and HET domain protein [Fusarium austroafricanum]|uniref:Putative ankyrin and HET domain protein n=1 Tax=Fusarium austroafricanum TaxID=2364996 RepID=A0A8H4KNT8_9HYPO|nr:putative ankyrin and HET domain protein [Fusarium austroafricanum]